MNRRDAMKSVGALMGAATVGRLLPGCVDAESELGVESAEIAQGYPPNFALLRQNTGWSTTWTQIVTGRFSADAYSQLLFYDTASGLAVIQKCDGVGRVILLGQTTVATGYTDLVVGRFDSSGFDGVCFFNRSTGSIAFYKSDGLGHLTLLSNPPSMGTTWTHVVSGFFTSSSFGGLVFNNQSTGVAQLWTTNGSGGLTFATSFSPSPGWTHVVPGAFIDSAFTHLCFYNATSRQLRTYQVANGTFTLTTTQTFSLDPLFTDVIAGNFGGNGNCQLLFYDRVSGTAYARKGGGASFAWDSTQFETLAMPTSTDLFVGGNFWTMDPEDHWFQEGPGTDPRWSLAINVFTGLLLYQRAAGTGSFYLHTPPTPLTRPALEGYITSATLPSSGSMLPGEQIDLHLSSAVPCTAVYFRPRIDQPPYPQLPAFSTPGVQGNIQYQAYHLGANWPITTSFAAPSGPSGLYVVRVTQTQAPGATLDIPFVVRTATQGSQSKILLVIPDANYEAYNYWGGRALYGFASADGFSFTAPEAGGGVGYSHAPYGFRLAFDRPHTGLFETANAKWQYWEVPMIRWLTQEGVPFEVCTARDLHFRAPTASAYRLMIFPGHHEYWSKEMRANVDAFQNAGGNTAFFGGNTCWWRVRIEDNGKTMVCYKQKEFDPQGGDATVATTHFANYNGGDPTNGEWMMTGVSYYYAPVPVPTCDNNYFTATNTWHWAFCNSGLADNSQFGTYNNNTLSVVKTETDMKGTNYPPLLEPTDFIKLAAAMVHSDSGNCSSSIVENGTMCCFSRHGGTVFNASVMMWPLGLTPNASSPTPMDTITRNVVTRLRVQPFHVGRTAAFDGLGQLTVAARKTDNSMWYARENGRGGPWSGWSSLGTAMSSNPVIARNPDGHLEAFAVSGGVVQHKWSDVNGNNWSAWNTMIAAGSGIAGRPVVAHNLDGRLEVFARGIDGGIWHAWQTDVNGPWSSWASLGAGFVGNPAVAIQLDGRMTVFARSSSGALMQSVQTAINGPWGAWVSLGGSLKGDPAVGRNLDGHLEVFAVLSTDQLAHIWEQSPGVWSAWTNLGTTAKGAPVIGVNADGRLEVFAVSLSGSVGHAWQLAPNGSWSGWASFGGQTNSLTPDVATNQDGRMELFVVNASDGVLYHAWQVAQNGAWSALTALPGISVIPD